MEATKAHGRVIRIAELSYFVFLIVWFFLPPFPGARHEIQPALLGAQLGAAGPRGIFLTL